MQAWAWDPNAQSRIKRKRERSHFPFGLQALDLLFELSIETNDEANRDFVD